MSKIEMLATYLATMSEEEVEILLYVMFGMQLKKIDRKI